MPRMLKRIEKFSGTPDGLMDDGMPVDQLQ
jgi:hypothetical protein